MCRPTATPEIHEEECEVIQHINAGDLVIKFDCIEERRAAINQDNIAQMHIAVTLTYETRFASFVELSAEALECSVGLTGQTGAAFGVENAGPLSGESCRITVDHPLY